MNPTPFDAKTVERAFQVAVSFVDLVNSSANDPQAIESLVNEFVAACYKARDSQEQQS